MKEVKITVNGKKYDVKVGDVTSSPVTVEVDGKTYQVELELPTVHEIPAIQSGVAAPAVKPVAAPISKPQSVIANGNAVRAPMPGTVVQVATKAGTHVKRGDTLLSLEAMKMKNAIRSPFDGVIKEVHVSDGQKVAYNDVLVSFE